MKDLLKFLGYITMFTLLLIATKDTIRNQKNPITSFLGKSEQFPKKHTPNKFSLSTYGDFDSNKTQP
jgi:hypothetical protein